MTENPRRRRKGRAAALAILAILPALPVPAQESFFIGPAAETAFFSRKGVSFGGGLAGGYGYDAGAMGFRALYYADADKLSTLELCFFLRFYLPPRGGAGLFIQLNTGASLFAHDGGFGLPAGAGGMSAGLSSGWRFLLGSRWYVEPYLRAGYPYIAGAGLSAGFRF